ncbi:MAG: hypothetical protein NVS9B3_16160 [Gemmatimonadaceae bacterium]
MDVIFHAHNAVISDHLRLRAERGVRRVGRRLRRSMEALVRVERDGRRCRIEIALRCPRHRTLVAEGTANFYGPALAAALARLDAQAEREHRSPKHSLRERGARRELTA